MKIPCVGRQTAFPDLSPICLAWLRYAVVLLLHSLVPLDTLLAPATVQSLQVWREDDYSLFFGQCCKAPLRASAIRSTFSLVALQPNRPIRRTFPSEGPRPPLISMLKWSST